MLAIDRFDVAVDRLIAVLRAHAAPPALPADVVDYSNSPIITLPKDSSSLLSQGGTPDAAHLPTLPPTSADVIATVTSEASIGVVMPNRPPVELHPENGSDGPSQGGKPDVFDLTTLGPTIADASPVVGTEPVDHIEIPSHAEKPPRLWQRLTAPIRRWWQQA